MHYFQYEIRPEQQGLYANILFSWDDQEQILYIAEDVRDTCPWWPKHNNWESLSLLLPLTSHAANK